MSPFLPLLSKNDDDEEVVEEEDVVVVKQAFVALRRKNNGQKEFRDSNQESKKGQYQDDWMINDSEW